jgi:ribosomal protein S27E
MSYPTCPGCREPQLVADEATEFRCFTCGTEVRFLACPECDLRQGIPSTWTMFTCGKCRKASTVPRYIPFEERPRASKVSAVGLTYPPT